MKKCLHAMDLLRLSWVNMIHLFIIKEKSCLSLYNHITTKSICIILSPPCLPQPKDLYYITFDTTNEFLYAGTKFPKGLWPQLDHMPLSSVLIYPIFNLNTVAIYVRIAFFIWERNSIGEGYVDHMANKEETWRVGHTRKKHGI